MVNYKSLAVVFVALSIIFAGATGYLLAFPPSGSAHGSTITQFTTVTLSASSGHYTVDLAYKTGFGFYLTNSSGFTLYFRSTDPGNGSSTCYGGCVTAWPLFYAGTGAISVPPGLSASSFGTATRSDGRKQTTYNGYPLYYYVNDKSAGEVTGEGVADFYTCCSVVSTLSTATSAVSSTSTASSASSSSSSGYHYGY
jgi:predicted lipoprotein with Yx(FWY)xxD motif